MAKKKTAEKTLAAALQVRDRAVLAARAARRKLETSKTMQADKKAQAALVKAQAAVARHLARVARGIPRQTTPDYSGSQTPEEEHHDA